MDPSEDPSFELPDFVAFATSDTAHHREPAALDFLCKEEKQNKQKSQFIRKPSTGKLKQWLPHSALSSSNPTKATLLPGEAALPGMRGTITTQDDG